MKTLALWAACAATALLCWPVTEAQAIPRTFVSGGGSGTACTRAAPCATFQFAHDATDPNGEINCLDAGNFGPVSVLKAITIDCAGTVGSISAATSDAIAVDAVGATVRLRNLTLEGFGAGFIGVNVIGAKAVFVESCVFDGFNNAISFLPGDSTSTTLFVSDSILRLSAVSGVLIAPTPNPNSSPRAVIDGVRLERNGTGIRVTGMFASGLSIVHLRNSVATRNTGDGIKVDTAGSKVLSVTADRTSATLNGANGVAAAGSNAFVVLVRSTAVSNGTGIAPGGGGAIFSYGNNHLSGNVTDVNPTATLSLR